MTVGSLIPRSSDASDSAISGGLMIAFMLVASLWCLLCEGGVSPRSDRVTPKQADEAIGLYESGLTIYEVIDRVGHSYGVINRMLHRRRVVVRLRRNQV